MQKKIKDKTITTTIRKILMLATIFAILSNQCSAQDNINKQKTISVTGIAQMEITPDEIYVQVDLSEYNKRNGDKIAIEAIKNNFLAACKNIGLSDSDVTVQSFSGNNNNYWWIKKHKKENPDMKATISYWVKVNSISKMDALVDKMDDEATQNFFIAKTSHSKMEVYKKQLKIAAIKAAKDKAVYLAEAIDEQIAEALTINDATEVNNYPQVGYYQNAMVKASSDETSQPAMDIDFKKIKLQFEVSVVFALK